MMSKYREDILYFKRALKYIKPYKYRLVFTLILIVTGIILSLVEPFIWAKVLSCLLNAKFEIIIYYIILMFIIRCLGILSETLQMNLIIKINSEITTCIQRDMINAFVKIPLKAFDEIKSGEFISRLNRDADEIASILTNELLSILVDILKTIIIGSIIFFISWILTISVIIFFIITYFIDRKYGHRLRNLFIESSKVEDLYNSNIHETVCNIKEIYNLGIQKIISKKIYDILNKRKHNMIQVGKENAICQLFIQIITILSHCTVIGMGVYLIIKKLLKFEYFVAFSSYSSYFSSSLMNLTRLNSKLQRSINSLNRIFKMLDNFNYNISFGSESNKTIDFENLNTDITFHNVSFGYDKNNIILHNLYITFKTGNSYFIVGASGSGKTSIFNLITRFYNEYDGDILIGDKNLKEISDVELRKIVCSVQQYPSMFNMTIRENLLLGNPFASENEIFKACIAACIHNEILNMPEGYETVLENNASNLSYGQKQRIAIARVLLKQAKIILFDEITSSIDNESQFYIHQTLHQISDDKTVLIITHRLSGLVESDNVIVIRDGRIYTAGTHIELLRNNDFYKNLYLYELKKGESYENNDC